MKKQYVIVEHRNSDAYNRQKAEIAQLRTELEKLHRAYRDLEVKYGNEVYYNNALCDILRNTGIPFHQVFSQSYRKSRYLT